MARSRMQRPADAHGPAPAIEALQCHHHAALIRAGMQKQLAGAAQSSRMARKVFDDTESYQPGQQPRCEVEPPQFQSRTKHYVLHTGITLGKKY